MRGQVRDRKSQGPRQDHPGREGPLEEARALWPTSISRSWRRSQKGQSELEATEVSIYPNTSVVLCGARIASWAPDLSGYSRWQTSCDCSCLFTRARVKVQSVLFMPSVLAQPLFTTYFLLFPTLSQSEHCPAIGEHVATSFFKDWLCELVKNSQTSFTGSKLMHREIN